MSTPFSSVPSISGIWQHTLETFDVTPCLWQACVAQAILQRNKDIIYVAGTKSSKTFTFQIPLLFLKNSIQIIVILLNILGKQSKAQLTQVGISSIKIQANIATYENFAVSTKIKFYLMKLISSNFQDIADGKHCAIIISPKELLK